MTDSEPKRIFKHLWKTYGPVNRKNGTYFGEYDILEVEGGRIFYKEGGKAILARVKDTVKTATELLSWISSWKQHKREIYDKYGLIKKELVNNKNMTKEQVQAALLDKNNWGLLYIYAFLLILRFRTRFY